MPLPVTEPPVETVVPAPDEPAGGAAAGVLVGATVGVLVGVALGVVLGVLDGVLFCLFRCPFGCPFGCPLGCLFVRVPAGLDVDGVWPFVGLAVGHTVGWLLRPPERLPAWQFGPLQVCVGPVAAGPVTCSVTVPMLENTASVPLIALAGSPAIDIVNSRF